jgi:hypothetical protein
MKIKKSINSSDSQLGKNDVLPMGSVCRPVSVSGFRFSAPARPPDGSLKFSVYNLTCQGG